MPGRFVPAMAAMFLLASFAVAADDQQKKESGPYKTVTITKVDANQGTIAVKYTDSSGKTQEKTYKLTEDVRILDGAGRVTNIAAFESGDEVVFLETAGKLREIRRSPHKDQPYRVLDTVRTLIEMAEADTNCAADLQETYDLLRKLDVNKDGKLDPAALKAEANAVLQDRVKNVFARLDTNKDGKISQEEARGLIKEHFANIDTNKDGSIEPDELLQAARRRSQQATNTGSTAPKK
jgi:Ca2+-binding EF-hand superfamily protein